MFKKANNVDKQLAIIRKIISPDIANQALNIQKGNSLKTFNSYSNAIKYELALIVIMVKILKM